MGAFKITLKQRIRINNETFEPGISVQISVYHNQPLFETQKISDAFARVHGIVGMKENGIIGMSYFDVEQVG